MITLGIAFHVCNGMTAGTLPYTHTHTHTGSHMLVCAVICDVMSALKTPANM